MSYPTPSDIAHKYNAVIMDLDGTLLDSMSLWNRVDIEFLSKRGKKVDKEYTETVKSGCLEDAALYTKNRFDLTESVEDIIAEWNEAVSYAYKYEVELKPGASAYIKALRCNNIRIAYATALSRVNAEAVLERTGLLKEASALLTLDDIGKRVDKSTPDIFLRAASLMNEKPDNILVYEDVPAAVTGASKGGFDICVVYDPIGSGSKTIWRQMKASANYFIEHW